jgi:hypothetical protein
MHFKNEGNKCKTGLVRACLLMGVGRVNERVKEGQYDRCTLYTYIKAEQ